MRTTQHQIPRLQYEMEEFLQPRTDRRKRRDHDKEDLLRAAFKFLSLTMLSVFLALIVVQVGLSQPHHGDPAVEQLKDLKRPSHQHARAW